MHTRKQWWAPVLGWLLVFHGLSAFAGGAAYIFSPDGSFMHADLAWLEGSPFNDFLVPGLVLFFGVGGSAMVAGILVILKWNYGPLLAFAAGAIVFGWISIQVSIINELSFLHFLYWGVGLVEMVLATLLWIRTRALAAAA